MRNFIVVAVFCLACGLCGATSQGDRYMDNIIRYQLPNKVKGAYLDPAGLHNFTDYVQTPASGRVLANFTNGQLVGLSEALRLKACLGPKYVGRNITLNCTIGFKNLKAIYMGQTRVASFPRFNAIGNLTQTYIVAYLTADRYANRPVVKDMFAYNLAVVPGRDYFQRSISDAMNRYIPKQVYYHVTVYFRNALQQSVQNVPLPLP